jgi:hypothetical protein
MVHFIYLFKGRFVGMKKKKKSPPKKYKKRFVGSMSIVIAKLKVFFIFSILYSKPLHMPPVSEVAGTGIEPRPRTFATLALAVTACQTM